jgi:hypothetical protein
MFFGILTIPFVSCQHTQATLRTWQPALLAQQIEHHADSSLT